MNMSIGQVLKDVRIARLEAELIIAHVLKQSREFVLIHPEFELTEEQARLLAALLQSRSQGEPLAYLLGHQEFYGLDFLVDKHTLIPRPETELMVDEALIRIKDRGSKVKYQIIDVGTGSGCIAISLAHVLNKDSGIRNQELIAIDISPEALKIAKQNAVLNGVDHLIGFIHGNLLEPMLNSRFLITDSNILILANLPYLTYDQVRRSPTIQHEPKSALISGRDGFAHYRQLLKQAASLKNPDIAILCEIDDTQGAGMSALIERELPNAQFEIRKDLGGYDRLAIIQIKNPA